MKAAKSSGQKCRHTGSNEADIFEDTASRIALETGTHSMGSPAVNGAGHEVIVAHGKRCNGSPRAIESDRHDARTLARLARIDPEL